MSILVTGANKGIGLAIVRGLVAVDKSVFLGSRDVGRGEEAKASLGDKSSLVTVVQLDVTDSASIASAATTIKAALGDAKLAGIINNAGGVAGGGMGFSTADNFAATIALNYDGAAVAVMEAFLPLLDTGSGTGRAVFVSSGAAPSFVAKCSAEKQAALCDRSITSFEGLKALRDEAMKISQGGGGDVEAVKAAFESAGLADGAPYHLSKALMSGYCQVLSKSYPQLIVNSCSPGFIETDLTRPFAEMSNKTPEEMGMKPVDDGAKCPLFLMLSELPTKARGWYWGSDCQRSPMDKYRSPGEPPYTGGESVESTASRIV